MARGEPISLSPSVSYRLPGGWNQLPARADALARLKLVASSTLSAAGKLGAAASGATALIGARPTGSRRRRAGR